MVTWLKDAFVLLWIINLLFLHLRITFYVNLQPSPRIMEWLGSLQVNSNGKTWAPFTAEHPLLIIEDTLRWKISRLHFNQDDVFWWTSCTLHNRCVLLLLFRKTTSSWAFITVCTDYALITATLWYNLSFDTTSLLLFSAHLPHLSSFVVTLKVAWK